MPAHTWWYLARSGGIVAWGLLALSMFWGLALSSRFLGKLPKPNWMLDLHRFLGGLAVIFTAIHVLALIGDSFISFGAVEVLIPFTGTYHPVAVAWGILSMYMLLAVEITSLLRKRMSKVAWRTTHYLSFPLFAFSTVHLLWAGTDRSTLLLRYGSFIVVAIVTTVTMIRLLQAEEKPVRTIPSRS